MDDRIRRALEEALPTPDVDPSVAERLLERFADSEGFTIDAEGGDVRFGDGKQGSSPGPPSGTKHRGEGSAEGDVVGAGVGGGPHLWFLVVGAAVGIAVGALLAIFTGGGGGGVGGVLPLDGVPIYSCPGDGVVGSLHRGDRVLIIGQADGWLAVRNVRGSGEVVYVEGRHVVADADTSGLPRRDCESEGILTIDSTTTTSLPDAGTTTVVATTTTAATTTTTEPATTTTAGDTTAPSISNASASPPEIWEEDTELISCPPAYPRESTISAFITDGVGVTQVTASWTLPGEPQSTVPMTGGPTYSATFGPFEGGTVPEVPSYDHDITITIRARDAAGNVSTTTVVVKVWSIASCFI